jgi:hypothetical protein
VEQTDVRACKATWMEGGGFWREEHEGGWMQTQQDIATDQA